jgi:SPW repeat
MTVPPHEWLPSPSADSATERLARYHGVVQTAAGLSAVTAVWLVASPWILGQERAVVPTWDQVAVGSLVGLVAALRLAAPTRFERLWCAEFALGFWTICAGFLLSYPVGFDRVPVLWNHILTGTVVLALAGFSAAARDSYVAAPRGAD